MFGMTQTQNLPNRLDLKVPHRVATQPLSIQELPNIQRLKLRDRLSALLEECHR